MPELLKELNMTFDELFPNFNSTSAGVGADADYIYTYHQGTAKFTGPSFDNSGAISVVGCSGLQNVNYCGSGECRNNAATQCCKNCGPIPQGQWRLSQEIVYHNMKHCYALSPLGGWI